jgi:PAS domain S-box-containing protein
MTAETSREALLEQMAEGFIALDPTLRVTKVNPVFEALAARSAGQLVGANWSDLFPLPTQAVIAEQMRRVLRTGEAVEFEADSTVQPGRCYGVRVFPYPGGVAALFANRTEEHEPAQAACATPGPCRRRPPPCPAWRWRA